MKCIDWNARGVVDECPHDKRIDRPPAFRSSRGCPKALQAVFLSIGVTIVIRYTSGVSIGMHNYLTFDIEEAFHSSNFDDTISLDRWSSLGGRVVSNTSRLIDLLAEKNLHATCFVVGWVAEHYPEVVRRIDAAGHEVAAHSHMHRLVYQLTPEQFRNDLRRNVEVLSSITGKRVRGFRAPSYTITPRTLWALDVLAEEGFAYDSSIYPVGFHPRYGIPGAPETPYRHANGLIEFPMPVASIAGLKVPVATGLYFRLTPYWMTKRLIRRMNKRDIPVVANVHPWELDPDQPLLPIKRSLRWRHYYGLHRTERKLVRLLSDFSFTTLEQAVEQIVSQAA